MRFLLLCVLLGFNCLWAHELVWKYSEHQWVEEQLKSRPIFLKRRLWGQRQIERREIGFVKSPWFQDEGSFYRFYEKFGDCYKLVVDNKSNTVVRLRNCKTDVDSFQIVVNGQAAQRVQEGLETPVQTLIDQETEVFKFTGHRNSFDEIEDFDNLNLYPTQEVDLQLSSQLELIHGKNSYRLIRKVKLERRPFSYLSERIYEKEQELVFPIKGDWDYVFEDTEGNLFFYMRYQPQPFTISFLYPSEKYRDYLGQVESLFYDFKGQKRCFRNDWITESPYDCDTLLLKRSFNQWNRFSLIKISADKDSFQLIGQ